MNKSINQCCVHQIKCGRKYTYRLSANLSFAAIRKNMTLLNKKTSQNFYSIFPGVLENDNGAELCLKLRE